MKGWLRRNHPPHEMVSAMTPATETPPAMGLWMFLLSLLEGEPRPIKANRKKGNVPEKGLGRVCCPEDVRSPSSSEAFPLRQMRAPAALDAPVRARCCCILKVAIEKVSPALPPRGFVMVVRRGGSHGKAMPMTAGVEPPVKAIPMAAGMEPPAGMPRGPASSTDGVPVKLCQCQYCQRLLAMTNVPEAAEMVNLAPTISKASAATFMIEEIGDYGLDSPSSRSPITPPAMPLIVSGFPQPGTPASAFGAISAPGDPDDELPMLEISDEG